MRKTTEDNKEQSTAFSELFYMPIRVSIGGAAFLLFSALTASHVVIGGTFVDFWLGAVSVTTGLIGLFGLIAAFVISFDSLDEMRKSRE